MIRNGSLISRIVSIALATCGASFLALGCSGRPQQIARTDSKRADPASSDSGVESSTTPDLTPTIEISDYENDPDYKPYTENYTDGRLKVEGGFRHGKRHGVWTYFRAFNGNTLRVERYRDGELLSMGPE